MIRPRLLLGLALLAAFSLGGYLLVSRQVYRVGFPLDDAWIHQGYARNLALANQWAFIAGQPSAGSTAPLWSAFLAIGYLLRLHPQVWAYALGWLALSGLAGVGYWGMRIYAPAQASWALVGGLLLVSEWHLVWAAGSGMETLPFALVVTAVLSGLAAGLQRWLLFGLTVGLSAWLRPDGITLLGPVLLAAALNRAPWRQRGVAVLRVVFGFAVAFGPYLAFNRSLAGDWWPNTFYAKQAEYAILQGIPVAIRYLQQLGLPLVGVGAALLPGFLWFTWTSWKAARWGALLGVLWWLGYLSLYAWRLPVTYQHGRYIIPAMPVWFLWGLAGLASLARPGSKALWQRVASRGWMAAAGSLLVVFWGLGASAYARDVAFIESEMVATAHWLAEHTESEALIAVHDIGAVGYFGQRSLIDLAGLVSPEVIPFIRDESRLGAYLDQRGADYLVTFPGWYPQLVKGAEPLFRATGDYGPESMAVYRWAGGSHR